MKKLFSLIVGIDNYPYVRALQGCVNDAARMKAYIESDYIKNKVAATDMRLLTEKEATKANIVAAFEAVANKIAKDDIFFFFFAGHGVREKTTLPLFVNAESDGGIETLVCYDSKVPQSAGYIDNTFLADKELRYLLAQIAAKNAKIFTVFDNCHSGDNTRAALPEVIAGEMEARKLVTGTVAERAWEGFIFAKKIDKNLTNGSIPLNELILLAPHIHISACRDIELAYESAQDDGKGRGGNFTAAFTRIMGSTQGNISLYHLQTRLSNLLRRTDEKSQSPQIDVYSGNAMDIHGTFLFSEVGNLGETFGYLDLTPQNALQISIGALNGAKKGMEVLISSQNDSSKTWKGTVSKATPGYSVVNVPNFAYKKTDTYKVTAKTENYGKVNLLLDTDIDGGVAKNTLSAHAYHHQYYELVYVEDEADYVLRAVQENRVNFYKMTTHCESRPLLQEIADFLPQKVAMVAEDLKQIAEWRFLKAFRNAENGTQSLIDSVKVRMFQMDLSDIKNPDSPRIEKPLDISQSKTTVYLTEKNKNNVPFSWIRFEIENSSNVEIYIGFLMLSSIFGVEPNVLALEEGVNVDKIILKPKEIVKTKSTRKQPGYFAFSLDDYIIKDKWEGQSLSFKLIASTTHFMTSSLAKNDIPAPYSDANRGVTFSDDEEAPSDFWFTKDIELFFPTPI